MNADVATRTIDSSQRTRDEGSRHRVDRAQWDPPSMKTAFVIANAMALGAGTFAMNRDARALGPVDVEVGARVGVAAPPSNSVALNPLGFGLGARGGVDFRGFCGGGQFMYYFGGTDRTAADCGSAAPCGVTAFSTHTVMYGIEAGYGITLIEVLIIRPQIGLGNATFSSSVSGSGATNPGSAGSSSNLYLVSRAGRHRPVLAGRLVRRRGCEPGLLPRHERLQDFAVAARTDRSQVLVRRPKEP
jgi:hypothetical protein